MNTTHQAKLKTSTRHYTMWTAALMCAATTTAAWSHTRSYTMESPANPLYLSANAIYSMPEKKFFTKPIPDGVDKKKYKPSWGGSLAVGYIFGDKFRTDLSANYRGKYRYKFQNSQSQGKKTVDNLSFMLNGYLTPFKFAQLSPYLLAGAGCASNKSYTSRDSMGTVESGLSTRSFTWQVGAGLSYAISDKYSADLAYKYADLGKIERGDSRTSADGRKVLINRNSGKMRAHEVSVGVIWILN